VYTVYPIIRGSECKNDNCLPRLLANKNVAKVGSICWYHVTDKNPAVVQETTIAQSTHNCIMKLLFAT